MARFLTAPSAAAGASRLIAPVALLVLIAGPLARFEVEDIGSAAGVVVVCAFLLRAFVRSRAELNQEGRDWLSKIAFLAFWLRLLLAAVILYGPWDRNALGEDQAAYDHFPRMLVGYWRGDTLTEPYFERYSERIGFLYYVALQYWIFGLSFIVPRVFNALGGALLTVYVYRIARLAGGEEEARTAAAWSSILPSMVLWASLNLRDIWLALSVAVILFHALRLRVRFSFGSLVWMALNFLWLQYNRGYLVLVMSVCVLAVFAAPRVRRLARDLALGVVLVGFLAWLHFGLGLGRESVGYLDLDRIAIEREKFARASVGQSGYLGDVDVSNPLVLAGALPALVVYFLYSPFPWQMTSVRRLITLPDMLVWYWMIPSLVRGIRQTLADRTPVRLSLLAALLVLILTFSIATANVGLAYRYRVQLIGPLLIFVAMGIHRVPGRRIR